MKKTILIIIIGLVIAPAIAQLFKQLRGNFFPNEFERFYFGDVHSREDWIHTSKKQWDVYDSDGNHKSLLVIGRRVDDSGVGDIVKGPDSDYPRYIPDKGCGKKLEFLHHEWFDSFDGNFSIPNETDKLYEEAVVNLARNRMSEAKHFFDKCILQKSDYAAAYKLRAKVFDNLGDSKSAESDRHLAEVNGAKPWETTGSSKSGQASK